MRDLGGLVATWEQRHPQAAKQLSTDFKLQLTSTDYGNFLANETPPVSTSTIAEKATQRLVDEFNYIRSNAGGELAKFLDYITYARLSQSSNGALTLLWI